MYMPQYTVETAILSIFYTEELWCRSRLSFSAPADNAIVNTQLYCMRLFLGTFKRFTPTDLRQPVH